MCVSGLLGTGLGVNADVITLGLDKAIELGSSYRYFEVCSDVNIEGLVTVSQDGINAGVGRFFVGGLGTGFDGYADGITLRL